MELIEEPEALEGALPLNLTNLHLTKRAFEIITQDQLATYLPDNAIAGDNNDATYGSPLPLVQYEDDIETDATVTVQQEFENTAFQIGSTGYLTGCTVVFVVSNRAVHAVSSVAI